MNVPRLSFIIMSTLASLPAAVQAQGPWPTMSQPSFFSPVQEFFTPRSYTWNNSQPSYSQYRGTSVIPGVPQCANGQCSQSCPNGQCSPGNRCANGQCSTPSQTYYQPQGDFSWQLCEWILSFEHELSKWAMWTQQRTHRQLWELWHAASGSSEHFDRFTPTDPSPTQQHGTVPWRAVEPARPLGWRVPGKQRVQCSTSPDVP